MKAKKIELNKLQNRLTLEVDEIKPYVINGFRRAILDYVQTMAIDEIEFFANDSVLYDEVIANRIGLIVLSTDLKTYQDSQSCKCKGEGCSACQVKLKLDVIGPKIVYAEDLISEDPKVKPVHPKTMIVKLLPEQKLSLIATAKLTSGNEHAKGSPGLSYYRYVPEVKIGKDLNCNVKECQKKCPKNVFEVKDGKLVVDKKNLSACDLCGQCVDLSEGQIKVEGKEDSYLFFIESWGQLDHKDIIKQAAQKLTDKFDEIKTQLK